MKLVKKYIFVNKRTGITELCTLEQALKNHDDLDMTELQYRELIRAFEAKHSEKWVEDVNPTDPDKIMKVETRGRKKDKDITGIATLERTKAKSTSRSKSKTGKRASR